MVVWQQWSSIFKGVATPSTVPSTLIVRTRYCHLGPITIAPPLKSKGCRIWIALERKSTSASPQQIGSSETVSCVVVAHTCSGHDTGNACQVGRPYTSPGPGLRQATPIGTNVLRPLSSGPVRGLVTHS
ncbi:unnamed protein product, partial [Iphiclides podalirius]